MPSRCIRVAARVAVWIALPLLAYSLVALLLGLLPVNRDFVEPRQGIDIYLRFNPVHTDILLPARSEIRNWGDMLKVPGIDKAQYLSFGWGDRTFYLETMRWADLRAGNALLALSGFDSTVLHVSAENQPHASVDMVRIRITAQQLRQLVEQIDASLARDAGGFPQLVFGAHYDNNDAFYEALGHYSVFFTCNDWVRKLLSATGIRTAMWAPFSLALQFQAARISQIP
jgi:uncharacterized protein (TIGR02117 family)